MAMPYITHHGFRGRVWVRNREKLEGGAYEIEGWLYLLLVAGLTVFFVISFSLL